MNSSELGSISPPMPRDPFQDYGTTVSSRATFVGSKLEPFPPTEVAIEEKKKIFSFRPKKLGAGIAGIAAASIEGKSDSISSGIMGSSGRSIASSITITEMEVNEQDIEGLIPSNSVLHESNQQDSRPFIPTRQDSVSRLSCDRCQTREKARVRTDSRPTKPRRSLSFDKNEFESITSRTASLFLSKSEELRPDHKPQRDQRRTRMEEGILSQKAAIFYRIVDVKTRKRGIRIFKKCFVGSQAVDAILQAGMADSRKEAVLLGQQLMDSSPRFRHITGSQTFKDKNLLYRFCQDESLGTDHFKWFPTKKLTQASKQQHN